MAIPGNVLVALSSAASWGGGDFCGGMGAKAAGGSTAGALRLVLLMDAASLAVLLLIVTLGGWTMPHGAPLAWGLASGLAVSISLTAFYIALSRGEMGSSAAVSGLLAAAIPAVVSAVLEGAPTALRLAGFVLVAVAIWLIAAGPGSSSEGSRKTLGLAIIAGMGFGFFFVSLRMANSLGVFEAMALSRCASLVSCSLMLLGMKLRGVPAVRLNREALGWAMAVAVLDTGGNLLFVAATRMGRLDVAAVLASLYPASTILLAAWWLHERPTRRQGWGMVVALAAVVMVTA